MLEWLKDYWLAVVCLVSTFVWFITVVGAPWWLAIIATILTWGCAGWLCYLATCHGD